MSDNITVRGFVVSDVVLETTKNAHPVAKFRIGSTDRRFDRNSKKWEDTDPNWYGITIYRTLAQNVTASIHKGERVVITGKLKLRQWVSESGQLTTFPEIEAETVGHDLMWGTAKFQRNQYKGDRGEEQKNSVSNEPDSPVEQSTEKQQESVEPKESVETEETDALEGSPLVLVDGVSDNDSSLEASGR